jgi:hypothetical protein
MEIFKLVVTSFLCLINTIQRLIHPFKELEIRLKNVNDFVRSDSKQFL